MRIGLLGGTFDPPHVAHLIMAEVARVQLRLDEVRFLVAGRPWMKGEVSDPEDRLAMARLAVEDDPAVVVDDRETRRDGPTYTADTLEQLRGERPGVTLVFIIGADQLDKLEQWERIDRALQLARFVVAPRPGHDDAPATVAGARIEPLEAPAVAVSSSDLRRRFRVGAAVRHQLPRRVERFIRERGLYGAGADAAVGGPLP